MTASPKPTAAVKPQKFQVVEKTWQNNRLYEGDGSEYITLAIDWNATDYPALRPASAEEKSGDGDLA